MQCLSYMQNVRSVRSFSIVKYGHKNINTHYKRQDTAIIIIQMRMAL